MDQSSTQKILNDGSYAQHDVARVIRLFLSNEITFNHLVDFVWKYAPQTWSPTIDDELVWQTKAGIEAVRSGLMHEIELRIRLQKVA